jgi:hypothetical protein
MYHRRGQFGGIAAGGGYHAGAGMAADGGHHASVTAGMVHGGHPVMMHGAAGCHGLAANTRSTKRSSSKNLEPKEA